MTTNAAREPVSNPDTLTDTAGRERRAAVTVTQDDDWVRVTLGDQSARLKPSEATMLAYDLHIASRHATETRWARMEEGYAYDDVE